MALSEQDLAKAMGSRIPSAQDLALRRHSESRMIGLRINRYSWWTHGRELADFFLPRRYKWLITPNQMGRGSPINQHILDSTSTLAARNLAAGMMYGITNPTTPWFRLRLGRIDSTQTNPIAIWLFQVEQMMMQVFQESNFYQSLAIFYFDLVIFGTASMIIYEDFNHVINCINPCFGEYYCDVNSQLNMVDVFYREFTYTVAQAVERWGIENVSPNIAAQYKESKRGSSAGLTREIVVAHGIEPNFNFREFGVPSQFKYREVYWEWGGSASPQGGSSFSPGLLDKRGFYENPCITARWDTVANDAYGRSPAMDALPDCKQLQLQVRRQAQGIDKQVNPPLQADIQLKNQPASLIPGGITYVAGLMSSSNPGMQSIYNHKIELGPMTENLELVRQRIKQIFFNDLFQTISQYQTRSNVTAEEVNARRAESLIMLGPVLERLQLELLAPAIDRTFSIMSRAGILPPAPANISGAELSIQYVSMLSLAQQAAKTAGIDRLLQIAGSLAGIDPAVVDNLDIDYALARYSNLMNNDPRLIRTPDQVAKIRTQRAQQQQQAQVAQQADTAQKLAAGAQTLSQTDVGGGKNAMSAMLERAA
ncbi:MAG TPA: portal protein [Candidatus Bathyarchaeia archaeon]